MIISFNYPCLITCDNPIFTLPNKDLGVYGNGLAGALEYWFPLDSSHLLVMGDPICSYPICKDRLVGKNESPKASIFLKNIAKWSNDMQIKNCYIEAYGRRDILRQYANGPLPKRTPFFTSGNNVLDSYYNEARMDPEPIMGHGINLFKNG